MIVLNFPSSGYWKKRWLSERLISIHKQIAISFLALQNKRLMNIPACQHIQT